MPEIKLTPDQDAEVNAVYSDYMRSAGFYYDSYDQSISYVDEAKTSLREFARMIMDDYASKEKLEDISVERRKGMIKLAKILSKASQ